VAILPMWANRQKGTGSADYHRLSLWLKLVINICGSCNIITFRAIIAKHSMVGLSAAGWMMMRAYDRYYVGYVSLGRVRLAKA
jgi:hypothetical protein